MEVNVYAAKANLSHLIDRATAGEEVVITRHGRPVARLVPADRAGTRRKLGLLENQGFWIADDFDAPLPDDLHDLFEGKGAG